MPSSPLADSYLSTLPNWQRQQLGTFRKLIHSAAPPISEEIKWNVPVFSLNGKLVFAMAAFKAHTKYNFILNGALLDDTDSLFNNSFESTKSRSIDLKQADSLNKTALQALISASITLAQRV